MCKSRVCPRLFSVQKRPYYYFRPNSKMVLISVADNSEVPRVEYCKKKKQSQQNKKTITS